MSNTLKSKIVVIGSANIDLVARTSRLPHPGETVLGSAFTMVAGGKGANQAVAAARLGAETHFIGRVGSDSFGAMILQSFHESGVHTTYLVQDPNSTTGTALIGVDQNTGENSIIVYPGANANLTQGDVLDAEEKISTADCVVLSLEIPTDVILEAVRLANRYGVRVVLYPAPAMIMPDEIIKSCSILTPNEHEVAILAGLPLGSPIESARRLTHMGAKIVVVTLGELGALCITDDGQEAACPTFDFGPVVDTTAAGDCFSAALAIAVSEGTKLMDALRFASVAAALSVTKSGAQASLPLRTEVDNALKTVQSRTRLEREPKAWT